MLDLGCKVRKQDQTVLSVVLYSSTQRAVLNATSEKRKFFKRVKSIIFQSTQNYNEKGANAVLGIRFKKRNLDQLSFA